MRRGLRLAVPIVLACTGTALPAFAQDSSTEQTESAESETSSLSLDPSVPEVAALPGGMTPAYGQPSESTDDWRFDFHGFLTAPMKAGLNTFQGRRDGDPKYVLHAPPVVPDDLETFSHTGVVPTPYVQLNFSYGNALVTGNVSILARQTTVSTAYFDPPSQAGINDVFLAVHPNWGDKVRLRIHVGSFENRYGAMGEYDEGRYGTPVIARIKGAGENIIANVALGRDFSLIAEQGIQGQTNKAPADLTPDVWNAFGDSNEGASFVHHEHLGLAYKGLATLGGHYIVGWAQDDRGTGTLGQQGHIMVLGADLRLTLGRFGHLYAAYANTEADQARNVGRSVEVLNTRGGPSLMQNYLGEEGRGTGRLSTWGAQYDLSIGKLVSYPLRFTGDGPDILVSLFGLGTHVTSNDTARDGVTKLKYGAEATYSLLSWLAASARWDRVDPNVDDKHYSFSVLSPRLIFHSDWQSTDQVVLQYSRWFNGSLTTVRTGSPPREDVTVVPDQDVISLSASMWW